MRKINFVFLILISVVFLDYIKANSETKGDYRGEDYKTKSEEITKAATKLVNSKKLFDECRSKNPSNYRSKCSDQYNAYNADKMVCGSLGCNFIDDNAEECESLTEKYTDDYKECRPSYENMSKTCNAKSNLEIIDNDTLQSTAPLMSMLSGADAILDIYGAMNENAQCDLSREDFKQERDSMKTDIKDIENQISDKTKEMQEAQEKFSDKLNEWADREREILDELNKIPIEKEKNRRKLDDQKVKTKIEAESKYSAVSEQMNTLTADYNAAIQDQKAALYQASDFAMFETCNNEYEKRIKSAGGTPVANGLSGAFYSGNLKRSDKVNYMANCLKIQRQNAKRVETAFVNKLNSIKQKLESLDRMKGQIEEERKLADQAIANEMKDLEYDADTKATSLRNEYQGIQTKKLKEQALLNQKLTTLKNEIANLTRKASVLKLKMQHYSTKKMPKSSDKSVAELIDKCKDFDDFKNDYTNQCCDGSFRKNKGLCSSFKIKDPPAKGKGKGVKRAQ